MRYSVTSAPLRVSRGADDAEFLEKQFAPTFSAADLMKVDNYNAFVRLLAGGKPTPPFTIETLPFISGSVERVSAMREMSYQLYGKAREEIEQKLSVDTFWGFAIRVGLIHRRRLRRLRFCRLNFFR